MNKAIVTAGGPENLLVSVANPDIETAQRLFKYPGIGLLVVTGARRWWKRRAGTPTNG